MIPWQGATAPVYLGSSAGSGLAECYEGLAEEAAASAAAQTTLDRVAELLLPAVVFAHEWRLVEAPLLAQGLALVLREGTAEQGR